MQLVFAPMWGRLSDRIGRRPVLIGGLIGTSASYVVFAYANSMPMLFAARAAAGFFGANVSTAQAYIADVTSARDRAKGMGVLGAAFGLGFTFGPLLGGELVGVSHMAPGFAAAALSLAAAAVGYLRLPEPQQHRRSALSLFGFDTFGDAMRNDRIGIVLVLYFLSIAAFSGFESMFIRFGLARFPQTFGVPEQLQDASMEQVLAAAPIAGRYMFLIGIIAAFVQGGLIRRLIPRYGETRLIVIGPFLLGLAFVLIGSAPVWSVVVLGCALMPFGFGVATPSMSGLLSRAVPAERQGAFLGLNQSLGSLARVVGPVLAAAMFTHFGPSSPFFSSAGLLAIATVLALIYRSRHHDHFEAQLAAGAE
jgi:MFS family permease